MTVGKYKRKSHSGVQIIFVGFYIMIKKRHTLFWCVCLHYFCFKQQYPVPTVRLRNSRCVIQRENTFHICIFEECFLRFRVLALLMDIMKKYPSTQIKYTFLTKMRLPDKLSGRFVITLWKMLFSHTTFKDIPMDYIFQCIWINQLIEKGSVVLRSLIYKIKDSPDKFALEVSP